MIGITIIPRRDVGDHIQLLPPERFSPELVDADRYHDAFEGRPAPQRGRRSRALNIVMVTKCAAWDKLPTGEDLYDAFHSETPGNRFGSAACFGGAPPPGGEAAWSTSGGAEDAVRVANPTTKHPR